MKVICLVGPANSGKTHTLKMLISTLAIISNNQLIVNPYIKVGAVMKPPEDTYEVFSGLKINEEKINTLVVCTAGDDSKTIINNFKFAHNNKADVIVMAVRSSAIINGAMTAFQQQCSKIGVNPIVVDVQPFNRSIICGITSAELDNVKRILSFL